LDQTQSPAIKTGQDITIAMDNSKSDQMGEPDMTSHSKPEVGKSNETSEISKVAFDEESFFAVLVLICVAGIRYLANT
jgi:hypothetical protein